jgi:hypothetical protein
MTVPSSEFRVPRAGARWRVLARNSQLATRHLALLVLVAAVAPELYACSVCYGSPGDPLVKGANNGIMFLLAVVGFVQIGFVAMFWSFWRRARAQRRVRESLRVIEGGARS